MTFPWWSHAGHLRSLSHPSRALTPLPVGFSSMVFPICPCLTPILCRANPVGSWPTQTPRLGCILVGMRWVLGSGPFFCVFCWPGRKGELRNSSTTSTPELPAGGEHLCFIMDEFYPRRLGFQPLRCLQAGLPMQMETPHWEGRLWTFSMKELRGVSGHFTFPSIPNGSLG